MMVWKDRLPSDVDIWSIRVNYDNMVLLPLWPMWQTFVICDICDMTLTIVHQSLMIKHSPAMAWHVIVSHCDTRPKWFVIKLSTCYTYSLAIWCPPECHVESDLKGLHPEGWSWDDPEKWSLGDPERRSWQRNSNFLWPPRQPLQPALRMQHIRSSEIALCRISSTPYIQILKVIMWEQWARLEELPRHCI